MAADAAFCHDKIPASSSTNSAGSGTGMTNKQGESGTRLLERNTFLTVLDADDQEIIKTSLRRSHSDSSVSSCRGSSRDVRLTTVQGANGTSGGGPSSPIALPLRAGSDVNGSSSCASSGTSDATSNERPEILGSSGPCGVMISLARQLPASSSSAAGDSAASGGASVVPSEEPVKQSDEICRLHAEGRCTPCKFFFCARGCGSGGDCHFCHMKHVTSRVRPSRATRQRFKRIAEGVDGFSVEAAQIAQVHPYMAGILNAKSRSQKSSQASGPESEASDLQEASVRSEVSAPRSEVCVGVEDAHPTSDRAGVASASCYRPLGN